MNATILVVIGYISWTILLLLLLASYRTLLVMKRERKPNQFKSDGSDAPEFGQRLTRAQANCAESLGFTVGILLLALATGSSAVTDGLAYFFLAARIGQSLVHIASTSVLAVQVRFVLFVVQIVICIYWLFQLFVKFYG